MAALLGPSRCPLQASALPKIAALKSEHLLVVNALDHLAVLDSNKWIECEAAASKERELGVDRIEIGQLQPEAPSPQRQVEALETT